ncbi:MAG: hypothetical protein ACI4BI_01810 [Anaerotardibacter sp.]
MATKKISVEVLIKFRDKRAKNKIRNIGDVYEVTENRLKEILEAGNFVKVVEPKQEEPAEDGQADKDGETDNQSEQE